MKNTKRLYGNKNLKRKVKRGQLAESIILSEKSQRKKVGIDADAQLGEQPSTSKTGGDENAEKH